MVKVSQLAPRSWPNADRRTAVAHGAAPRPGREPRSARPPGITLPGGGSLNLAKCSVRQVDPLSSGDVCERQHLVEVVDTWFEPGDGAGGGRRQYRRGV